MPESRVVLYGRAGCHLCDVAREVVVQECRQVEAQWREVDVDTDPALQARYGEYVPVVTVDGVTRGYWQIERERLRAALQS